MRRIVSSLFIVLNLVLTGPAIAHDQGPLVDHPIPEAGRLTAIVAQNTASCHTALFRAGEHPASPLTVRSITCLDTSCDTREILLCPLTD